MTTLSRILGFVRDIMFARLFGASAAMDAFLIAFKIPNFFRRLFAEGAFNQAFVPVLSACKAQHKHADLQHLVDRVAGSLGIILSVITVLGMLLAPLVIMVFAPGAYLNDPDKYRLASDLLRLTFPYLLFISLTALAGGILNTMGRYWVPSFTPVLLNVCMIAAALWLAPRMDNPIESLAWGVFVAGIVQFLFQIPFLMQVGLLPRPKIDFADAGVQKIKTLIIPALFGVSVSQINLLLDLALASLLITGSISWLYFSDRLMEFPLGVFGVALATVILPSLSKKHAQDDPQSFSDTLDWALRLGMIIGLPAAIALAVLAGPMISTLFQSEAFSAEDVRQSSHSLMAYAAGLLGFMFIKVLAPGFFARQDTKTPVKIGIISMAANMLFNLILIWHLKHVGLALATSISSLLNASLLYWKLRTQGVYMPLPGWFKLLLQVGGSSMVMATMLWFASGTLADWTSALVGYKILWLLLLIVLGTATYFMSLRVVGVDLKGLLLGRQVSG